MTTRGDSAFLELITWQVGEFRFWPDETTLDRTINKRLDGMLMEGVALLDQNKYLETAGPQARVLPGQKERHDFGRRIRSARWQRRPDRSFQSARFLRDDR